jgi:hypothetical protein
VGAAGIRRVGNSAHVTSTKVQILTPEKLRARRCRHSSCRQFCSQTLMPLPHVGGVGGGCHALGGGCHALVVSTRNLTLADLALKFFFPILSLSASILSCAT